MKHIDLSSNYMETFFGELMEAYKKQLPGNFTPRGDEIQSVLQMKLCLVVRVKNILGVTQDVMIDAPEMIVNKNVENTKIITKGNG